MSVLKISFCLKVEIDKHLRYNIHSYNQTGGGIMPTKLDHKLTALLAIIIEHLRNSDDEKLKEFVEKYDKGYLYKLLFARFRPESH